MKRSKAYKETPEEKKMIDRMVRMRATMRREGALDRGHCGLDLEGKKLKVAGWTKKDFGVLAKVNPGSWRELGFKVKPTVKIKEKSTRQLLVDLACRVVRLEAAIYHPPSAKQEAAWRKKNKGRVIYDPHDPETENEKNKCMSKALHLLDVMSFTPPSSPSPA